MIVDNQSFKSFNNGAIKSLAFIFCTISHISVSYKKEIQERIPANSGKFEYKCILDKLYNAQYIDI